MPDKAKRGYSRAFPSKEATRKSYLLVRIPAQLWVRARAQARRDRKSMRALLLEMLTTYTSDPVNTTGDRSKS